MTPSPSKGEGWRRVLTPPSRAGKGVGGLGLRSSNWGLGLRSPVGRLSLLIIEVVIIVIINYI